MTETISCGKENSSEADLLSFPCPLWSPEQQFAAALHGDGNAFLTGDRLVAQAGDTSARKKFCHVEEVVAFFFFSHILLLPS